LKTLCSLVWKLRAHRPLILALFVVPAVKVEKQSVSPANWPSVCAPSGMTPIHPRPQMLRPMVRLSRSTSFNLIVLKC
jgi:hypothetical protein